VISMGCGIDVLVGSVPFGLQIGLCVVHSRVSIGVFDVYV
jgi:hypothetical protein